MSGDNQREATQKNWYGYSSSEYFTGDLAKTRKNRGYAFIMRYDQVKGKGPTAKYHRVFLPISPQELTVNELFATNLVATIGGVVEEHAPNRFLSINISGTTGHAPKNFTKHTGKELRTLNSPGRKPAYRNSLFDPDMAGGFGGSQVDKVKKVADQAKDLLNMFSKRKRKSGIHANNTGYWAFKTLYSLLRSSKRASLKVNEAPCLYFVNYKDNFSYACVISTFTLTRSSANPMAYDYNIVLRAYDAQNADKVDSLLKNSFVGPLLPEVLGPKPNKNIASKLKLGLNKAKDAIRSAAGAVEGWWR
jgi:hypothetical protein